MTMPAITADSASTALTGAQLAAHAVPVIIDLARLAEELYPDSGTGARKLAFIQDFLRQVQTPETIARWDEFWPAARVIVDSTVRLGKLTGAFKS